ncbi:hypothetical protein ACWDA3_27865 [Nonomuraea rubra]
MLGPEMITGLTRRTVLPQLDQLITFVQQSGGYQVCAINPLQASRFKERHETRPAVAQLSTGLG